MPDRQNDIVHAENAATERGVHLYLTRQDIIAVTTGWPGRSAQGFQFFLRACRLWLRATCCPTAR